MSEPVWLDVEILVDLHAEQLALFGGPDGIRDQGMLESALGRPINKFSYGEHDLAVKSLESGAYAFLQKPLHRAFLLAWLKRAIELRQLSRALEESEARFRILTDAAFEAIALTENGHVLDVNHAFLTLFGYEREEVVGMAPGEFHPPEFREVARHMNLSGAETRYEALCQKKDGLLFRAEIRGRAVPYRGRTVRVTALHPLPGQTQVT